MALQRLHEGCLVVVVDFLDFRTGWHCACAVSTSDGGDFVLSGLEQLLCNEFADLTAGLSRPLASRFMIEMGVGVVGTLTYPNDGNFLHIVFETLRLLAGVFLSHGVDGRRDV